MKVRDTESGQDVDVWKKECPTFMCYWPRVNPGTFVHGRGYHSNGNSGSKQMFCGNRAIRGCPDCPEIAEDLA